MIVSINIAAPNVIQLIVYLIIGFAVTLLIGLLGQFRSPGFFFGFILLSALGGWLTTSFIRFSINPEVALADVRVIEAVVGALIFGLALALYLTRHKILVK